MLTTHTNPRIRTQSILQPFEPCLDDREGRPGRLYRSGKPEARIRALEEALPRGDVSFAGANQRQHVQIADPAGTRALGSVYNRGWPSKDHVPHLFLNPDENGNDMKDE